MKVVSAQMLLNPLAGTEATFHGEWFTTYEVYPKDLTVYILVDPSKGKGARSDRTAIAVIGLDPGGSKYLLDEGDHFKIEELATQAKDVTPGRPVIIEQDPLYHSYLAWNKALKQ